MQNRFLNFAEVFLIVSAMLLITGVLDLWNDRELLSGLTFILLGCINILLSPPVSRFFDNKVSLAWRSSLVYTFLVSGVVVFISEKLLNAA